MRRVLIVAPAFPPHPSPATHRARFVGRYADEFGWSAEVVAVAPAYYDDRLDHELVGLLPRGLQVTQCAALPARLTRRMGIGDLGIRAYIPMKRVVRDICGARRPDLLFLPGWPFYTFRLGADILEEFGIPFVLDYTDPWVFDGNPGIHSPWKKAFWAHRLAIAAEPRAVRNAAHILAVSDGTNASIRARYPDISSEKFSAVPFGFEPDDYRAVRGRTGDHGLWDPHDGNLHALYMGVLPADAAETLHALLEAVRLLRETGGEAGRRLRIHFVGTSYDPRATTGAVQPLAASLGLASVVTERVHRVSYVDALSALVTADLILGLGTTARHYTASKIFPCVLAGKPLLSIYHAESSVCDIVTETRAGALVTFDDAERVATRVPEILARLQQFVRGESLDSGHRHLEALEKYSARTACRHIFSTFDRVVASTHAEAARPDREEVVIHA